jgi:hypothetical protein
MEHSSHLPKLANAVTCSLSGLQTAELKHGCISVIYPCFSKIILKGE